MNVVKPSGSRGGRGLARYDGRVELLCDGVLNGHSNFKQSVLFNFKTTRPWRMRGPR